MKSLFIYYSYTGNGELIAKELEKKGIDLRPVKRKKPLPKSFFLGMMSGGFLAATKHKDELVDFDPSIEGYERIIIGSPIWNARLASPINTVLASLHLEGKAITLLLYSGSGEGKKAVKRIGKEYPEAKIILFKEPKKYPEELDKLNQLS